jgi:protein TonB
MLLLQLIAVPILATASDEFGLDFTTKPKLLPATCGTPLMPAGSASTTTPGVVEVIAAVDATGALVELRIAKSSGWPALDQAVLEAYRSCQFQPAIQNRVPVAGERELHYEWAPPRAKPTR